MMCKYENKKLYSERKNDIFLTFVNEKRNYKILLIYRTSNDTSF